jgi:hypothetical protein
MPNLRWKKIKRDSVNRVHLEYEQRNGKTWDEHMMTSADEPAKAFPEAMNALAEHVLDICELPAEWLNRIRVSGVSFSYGGDAEVRGATLIATRRLDHANPMNLITPHKPEDSYSGNEVEPETLLSPACVRALDALCEAAQAYLNGERAQLALPGMMDAMRPLLQSVANSPGFDSIEFSTEGSSATITKARAKELLASAR